MTTRTTHYYLQVAAMNWSKDDDHDGPGSGIPPKQKRRLTEFNIFSSSPSWKGTILSKRSKATIIGNSELECFWG
jgi:hypothetical protein